MFNKQLALEMEGIAEISLPVDWKKGGLWM